MSAARATSPAKKTDNNARLEPLKLGEGLGISSGGGRGGGGIASKVTEGEDETANKTTAATKAAGAGSSSGVYKGGGGGEGDGDNDSDESFELDDADISRPGAGDPDAPTYKKKEPTFIKRRFIGTNSTHIKLAFIGNTNVGKSSLFNAFIDEDLSPVEDSIFTTTELYVGNITPLDYKYEYYNKAYKPAISTR